MGEVTDDNDLHGTFYVAVDNDYLYIAAEILDDVVVDDQASGWWTSDVVQVCIGLYDQRGPKHVGMQRGEEPDYKMYFLPDGAYSDNGAGTLAEHGDGNYFHETYNPDYAFEFRISLDDIMIDENDKLVVIDFKATAKKADILSYNDVYNNGESYKRQLEIYSWLLKKNNFDVSDTGYLMYYNGDASKPHLGREMHFRRTLVPFKLDTEWISPLIQDMYDCLQLEETPDYNPDCPDCIYLKTVSEL